MTPKILFAIGSVLSALAVILGAFGAHGLRETLGNYEMSIYEKSVFYHFVHAAGLLLIALALHSGLLSSGAAIKSAYCMLAGTIIFSGSLYLLAVTGQKWLGAITPIGGTLFIVSWLLLAYASLSANS